MCCPAQDRSRGNGNTDGGAEHLFTILHPFRAFCCLTVPACPRKEITTGTGQQESGHGYHGPNPLSNDSNTRSHTLENHSSLAWSSGAPHVISSDTPDEFERKHGAPSYKAQSLPGSFSLWQIPQYPLALIPIFSFHMSHTTSHDASSSDPEKLHQDVHSEKGDSQFLNHPLPIVETPHHHAYIDDGFTTTSPNKWAIYRYVNHINPYENGS